MIYNKTLHPDDYKKLSLARYIEFVKSFLQDRGCKFRFEHEHRMWEYALGLHLAVARGGKTLLDVGGGSSIFAPAATMLGFAVTQVDPRRNRGWVAQQSKAIGRKIHYVQEDFLNYTSTPFDVVTCVSVIEHVPEHEKFFRKLLDCVAPKGVLYLTTDYHESGERLVKGHLRTYNQSSLREYKRIASALFDECGDFSTYVNGGDYVNGYNFASLALSRIGR